MRKSSFVCLLLLCVNEMMFRGLAHECHIVEAIGVVKRAVGIGEAVKGENLKNIGIPG